LFTDKLEKLTISVQPPKMTPDDQKKRMEANQSAQDAK